MATIETLESIVRAKGWLAIASLYFDNSYEILIPRTNGCIAYSPSAECFFARGTLDNDNNMVMRSNLVTLNTPNDLSPLTAITITGFDMLQHFDTSLYMSPIPIAECMENGAEFPEPTYPDKSALLADGVAPTHTLTLSNYGSIDGVAMYEDGYAYARIEEWKLFYKNQDNFIKFIKNQYGFNDCI